MNEPLLDLRVREFNSLRQALALAFDVDADDEAAIGTAEGETDLDEMLVRMIRAARHRAAQAEVCAEQIKALAERKERHTKAAERLRAMVANAMLETGIKKLSPGDFTASVRMLPAKPEVVDVMALPEFYTHIVRKPDLEAIKGEFNRCVTENDDFSIPGVVVSNGKASLTVRI